LGVSSLPLALMRIYEWWLQINFQIPFCQFWYSAQIFYCFLIRYINMIPQEYFLITTIHCWNSTVIPEWRARLTTTSWIEICLRDTFCYDAILSWLSKQFQAKLPRCGPLDIAWSLSLISKLFGSMILCCALRANIWNWWGNIWNQLHCSHGLSQHF